MRKDFKLYRISLNLKEDADVINILESMPKTFRSLFVADAIRFVKKVILETGLNPNSFDFASLLKQLSRLNGSNLKSKEEVVIQKDDLPGFSQENKETEKETQINNDAEIKKPNKFSILKLLS